MAKRDIESNKNQTAAERAQANMALSGKVCTKCSQEIRLRDLLNVREHDLGTNRVRTVSYHRSCYGS